MSRVFYVAPRARRSRIVTKAYVLPEDGDVLDVAGARTLLGIGRNQLYAACKKGQIPHRKIGKTFRFSRAALIVWLGSSPTKSLSGKRRG